MVDSWGGQGAEPGRFRDPNGIAVAHGRVYVADSRNHRIQVFGRSGDFVAQWPVPGEGRPMNLDVAGGRLYAADYWNDVIRVYSMDTGELVASLGGGARDRADSGIPVASRSARAVTLFVADTFNDRIQVFGPGGAFLRKWGGPFAINIRGDHFGWFKVPTGVALGLDGRTVFVADQENNRVQKFTRGGVFLTAFGTPHEGPGYTESAVAVAADGTLYSVNLVGNRAKAWQPATESAE